jgi:hypothetical protein
VKNKQLQKLALGAEIITAVAIVVTLGILAVEMRANTNAIHDRTYQELTQQLNNYRTDIVQSGWLDAREKLLTDGWESLTRIEKSKLLLLRNNLYGIYEMAYYSEKRGAIGQNEWIRFQFAICTNYQRDVERGLWGAMDQEPQMKSLLTPDFAKYITETCI